MNLKTVAAFGLLVVGAGSIGVTAIGGARQAARLDPIASLRFE